ncbi:MAG: DUF3429 domain-containing protein [Betaproteobacteria bacterium]
MAGPADQSPTPKTPFWLGTAGLVPFVVITSALWALPEAYAPALLFWLTSYAAIVLSFIGAVHWGAAMLHPSMPEHEQGVFMTWSIVPAIVAWVTLLMPVKTGLLLLIATYVIQFAADRQFAQRFTLPLWYLRMRAGLTSVAVLCLVMALAQLARH